MNYVEEIGIKEYVSQRREEDLRNIIGTYNLGFEIKLNNISNRLSGELFYNNLPYHTAATALNHLDSFLLAYYTQDMNRSITTTNEPIARLGKNNFIFSISDAEFSISDLDLFGCIEAIPGSFLDIVNGI